MASNRTIRVIKKEHRLSSDEDVTPIRKTTNQLRREMVQTVADWIAESLAQKRHRERSGRLVRD